MWDGLDCITDRRLAPGIIIIIITVPPAEFADLRTMFLRQIGNLLHTVVVIAHDLEGNEMIAPWEIDDVSSHRNRRSAASQVVVQIFRQKRAAVVGYVTLVLISKL